MLKNIIILGSTGSIGKSTLKVIKKYKKKFNVKLLTTNNNVKKILSQAITFNTKIVVIKNKEKYLKYKNQFKKKKIKVFFNIDHALSKFKNKVYYTINAISGLEGLEPTISVIRYTNNIAIANKESIICGWRLIAKELKKNKTNFIPIDSEHFSIWSLIKNENKKNINKIYLTASGGPFLNKNIINLKNIRPSSAIKHPNWKMGKKISIDSATMMNKVFEVLEANKIFNLNINIFNIVIHPSSYVHAIVNFKTGLIKVLAHDTSMEIPIANSLHKDNEDFSYINKNINFVKFNNLKFMKPNIRKFPLLKTLKLKPKKDSYFETILVTLNDELVKKYLNNEINYFSLQQNVLKLIKHPYFIKYYSKNPSNINDIKNMVKKVKTLLRNYLKNYDK